MTIVNSGNIDYTYEEASRNTTSHSIQLGSDYIGKEYKVFVRQVLTDGRTSDLSEPVTIKVGDVLPPPPPVGFDITSRATNGNTISLVASWDAVDYVNDETWEDLDHYVFYYWLSFANLPSSLSENIANYDSRVYDRSISTTADGSVKLTRDTSTYTVHGTSRGQHCFIGLQAVDTAGNASNIYVIHTLSDASAPSIPTGIIFETEPSYGSVNLILRQLPASTEFTQINFYTDDNGDVGGSADSTFVSQIPYPSCGGTIRYRDIYVSGFAYHSYRFSLINAAGIESARSPYTVAVCPQPLFNKDNPELKGLLDSYFLHTFVNLASFNESSLLMANYIGSVADSLKGAHTDIDTLYDRMNIATNELKITSAAIGNVEYFNSAGNLSTKIVAMGTQLDQNATDIKLRATAVELGNHYNEAISTTTTLFELNNEGIHEIVTNLDNVSGNHAYSSITHLADNISLKVNKDDVISAINVSPEKVAISGKKITITGDTTFANDVTIKGNLSASDVTILNPDGSIAFGGASAKYIPQMGFLSAGEDPVQVPFPNPSEYIPSQAFTQIKWNNIYSTELVASGLSAKYAVLNASIIIHKDADCVVQARMYVKFGDTYYYGSIGELATNEYQETVTSLVHIPSIDSGTWEVGVQARRTKHTYGTDGPETNIKIQIKESYCQYFILGA